MKPVRSFRVHPRIPDRLRALDRLAHNLRWSWDHESIDLFRDREGLTSAIAAALPQRRERIDGILDRGFLCLEESHLGVHRAYSLALGDTGFVDAYATLRDALPQPGPLRP